MTLAPDYLERFTLRNLQDALTSATRRYWEARAAVLEAARPRPGDFHGNATPEALAARYARLTADAEECRRHAAILEHATVDADLIAEVLGWDLAADDASEAAAA
ncbi:hypothetical protein [Raineyella sp.]|uniref:hypothetical protein n=1 Tax=Raineyella sp. TaxID=1911550 RepID=UPI002B209832|nr:hypothetical protein [Raineyella sp.]MEA5155578.1 hypothetical protein [Raineyella sp.]